MSVFNIASNLLFQWMLLTILGPGVMTDALFAGLTLPQLFTAIVGSSLTQVLIPILVEEPYEDQRRDAWTLFTYSAALFTSLAIALIVVADWWVPLTVPGFTADTKLTTVELARISLLGVMFTGVSAVQAAMGFARRKYLWTDAAPMTANLLSVLLLLLLLPQYGIWAAAWISVLRLLVQMLLLLPVMGKPAMPESSRPLIQIAMRRLKPILIGASYYKLDPLLDRYLLSAALTGSLSLLYFAQQLHSVASQVLVKTFVVPAITELAALHKKFDRATFSLILRHTLRMTLIVSLLSVFAVWLVGDTLLAWGMAHGKFSNKHAHELWELLVLSAGMLVGGALGALTSGAFYARGDTFTPTWLGALSFTVAIAVKVFAFKLYGTQGLAVAISTYYLSSFFIQAYVLRKQTEIQISKAI